MASASAAKAERAEPEFATHLSGSLIERTQALSYQVCKGFSDFGYNWEDVAQQTIEKLLTTCQAGKLYQKTPNRYLLFRIHDSIRELQGGVVRRRVNGKTKRVPKMDLVVSEELTSSEPGPKLFELPSEGNREEILRLEEGAPLADRVRNRFDSGGGLWSREFHQWLDDLLRGIQEEAALAIHKAKLLSSPDPDLIRTKGSALVRKASEARLIDWIQANPGKCANHAEIGEEIGATRETVSRVLNTLIRSGKVKKFVSATACTHRARKYCISYLLKKTEYWGAEDSKPPVGLETEEKE